MKNIKSIKPFQYTVKTTDLGLWTTLEAKVSISSKGSLTFEGKSILANYVYDTQGNYRLVYTIIDIEGREQSYVEDDGILPTLFLSPDGENYVSIVPYHPDKELEVSLPVFNRESVEMLKGNRPFMGDYIGISNQFAIFYYVDIWSESKPDKLLSIEFKARRIVKKQTVKIPLPRENKIFVFDGQIHLLGMNNGQWLHRRIDEKGGELQQRHIASKQDFFYEAISLSFDRDSYLLGQEEGMIILEKIDPAGRNEKIELLDIGEPIYNTWQPVQIADDTFVVQFNAEEGNGWLTISNGDLLEFFYSKGNDGYRNLLTGELMDLGEDNLVISSINSTSDRGYAVVFYPFSEEEDNNKLFILNRKAK